MQLHTLYCNAWVGIAGSASVDFLGVPELGECMLLIAAVGIFFAAGCAIFQVWGKSATPKRLSVDPAFAA